MKIVVFPDDVEIKDGVIDDWMIDACQCMVTVDDDRKGFVIDRQIALSNTRLFMKHLGYKRSISELKHVLLAEKIKDKQRINDEI